MLSSSEILPKIALEKANPLGNVSEATVLATFW
jgi:hypothetical protein